MSDELTEGAGHRRWGRIGPVAAAAVLVIGAGWAGWASGWLGRGETAEAGGPPGQDPPAATAEVTRQTLTATTEVPGTLGRSDLFTVTTAGPGVITAVAEPGDEVTRGMELYRLDERPVTALYGRIPMYRDLRAGLSGADVEQLERNLRRLGYEGFTVDTEFTGTTAGAVRRWQADLGLPETGTVRMSDVVFVDAGDRLDGTRTAIGATVTPGTPVLDLTGSEQVVRLEVEVADRELLALETPVTVELPDGDRATGVVTAATMVRSEPPGSPDGAEPDALTEVEVTLDEPVEESLLGAPVVVIADVEQREEVLTVPVNALLALAAGGHGLEVVAADGSTSLVPVTTGLYAQGRVEVEGDGIEAGTVVGVAGR